jgi:hypothetical protein
MLAMTLRRNSAGFMSKKSNTPDVVATSALTASSKPGGIKIRKLKDFTVLTSTFGNTSST